MNDSFLIIADGHPSTNWAEVAGLAASRMVLVLDGAANLTMHQDLKVDLILGDLDSISQESLRLYQAKGVQIIEASDQDFTDLEKAIIYCDQHHARDIVIVNALGNRTDHSLGNLGCLKQYYNPARQIIIHNQDELIEYIEDTSKMIVGKIGHRIALLGFPSCVASSEGLKYELNQLPLSIGGTQSLCNSAIHSTVRLQVTGGAIIINSCSDIA